MSDITLRSLRIQGFKSFKKEVSIDFTGTFGLNFICGVNKVDQELGANGAGKSSVWDALCWCWYGSTTRGKKGDEVRSWGSDFSFVETIFTVGDFEQRVARSSHPERIEGWEGEPWEQKDIDSALHMSKAAFLQSVLFGQATPLFYDLPVPARGTLLDEVMDTDLWMRLSDDAGKAAALAEKELAECFRQMAYLRGQLNGLPDESALRARAERWEEDRSAKLGALRTKLDEAVRRRDDLDKRAARMQRQIDAEGLSGGGKLLAELRQDITNLTVTISSHEHELDVMEKALRFYEEHSDCPICKQKLSRAFVRDKIAEIESQYGKTKRALNATLKARQNYTHEKDALEARLSERRVIEHDIDLLNRDARSASKDVRELESQIDDCKRQRDDNPYLQQIDEADRKRRDIRKEIRHQVAEQGKLERRQGHLNYWKQGFKRVRLFEMKRVMQRLELETMNAAEALGLIGWRISFATEIETKSGSMRSGIHITIDAGEQKPREWSPGELQRVRLAVTLGMAHFIQHKAGVNFTFEVFDEPSNWLSTEGVDDLLEQLTYRAQSQRRTIWLVDHRNLTHAGFTEVWQATKREEGSSFERLA